MELIPCLQHILWWSIFMTHHDAVFMHLRVLTPSTESHEATSGRPELHRMFQNWVWTLGRPFCWDHSVCSTSKFAEWSRHTGWVTMTALELKQKFHESPSVALQRGQCSHHCQQQPHTVAIFVPRCDSFTLLRPTNRPKDPQRHSVKSVSWPTVQNGHAIRGTCHSSLQVSGLRNRCAMDHSVDKNLLGLPVCLSSKVWQCWHWHWHQLSISASPQWATLKTSIGIRWAPSSVDISALTDWLIVDSFSHVWRLFCTLSGVSFWLSTFGSKFVLAIANVWQFKRHPKLCRTPKLAFLINRTHQNDWANWTNWLADQPAEWLGQLVIQLVAESVSWFLLQLVSSSVSWSPRPWVTDAQLMLMPMLQVSVGIGWQCIRGATASPTTAVTQTTKKATSTVNDCHCERPPLWTTGTVNEHVCTPTVTVYA